MVSSFKDLLSRDAEVFMPDVRYCYPAKRQFFDSYYQVWQLMVMPRSISVKTVIQ